MKGEVAYLQLGERHVSLVRDKIVFRGHTFDPKDGIRKLSSHLKEIDTKGQKQHLTEKIGNVHPDETLINPNAHLPLHPSLNAYEIALMRFEC